MRARGVVGKRIVAIRQRRFYSDGCGDMVVAVDAIILEDGTELRPLVVPIEDDNVTEIVVVKPERR